MQRHGGAQRKDTEEMKFENLKPGMLVYDVGRSKMGNTTLSTVGVWRVRIESVDVEARRVTASWNSNPPKTFYPREVAKWREKEPLLIRGSFGRARLATREEMKRARETAAMPAAPVLGAA
jgi:hypothetical protein